MATRRDANPQATANSGANAITFDRFAGVCAIITGLSSVLYAVFFLLVRGSLNTYLPSVFLALGGFLALLRSSQSTSGCGVRRKDSRSGRCYWLPLAISARRRTPSSASPQ